MIFHLPRVVKNSVSKRFSNKLAHHSAEVASLAEIPIATLLDSPESRLAEKFFSKNDLQFWRQRLLLRRYHFPASGESGQNLAAYIEHEGTGYFFPLGSADVEIGREKWWKESKTCSQEYRFLKAR